MASSLCEAQAFPKAAIFGKNVKKKHVFEEKSDATSARLFKSMFF